MLTLHQLRIFWTLAHSPSLTQAAKQLGVSQPSLSQQLAKLERAIGTRLFDRRGGQLRLTDAGRFLVDRAHDVLADVERIEAGLDEFRQGRRARVVVGALASLARTLLPDAVARARRQVPGLELDVHELAPRDCIEQLYARGLSLALVSETAVARDHLSFAREPICADGYVLATPRGLALDGIADPAHELDAAARALLSRTIQFNFGTLHQQRVEAWYRSVLTQFETVARARNYETALAMVEAGLGVALVPQLTTQLGGRFLFDVELYAVPQLERRVVALFPSHHRRLEPLAGFLAALIASGEALRLLPVRQPPPFFARAARCADDDRHASGLHPPPAP